MRFLGRIGAVFGTSICPRCRGSYLYLSRRKSDLEKVLGAFSIRPLRCRDCNHRFWRLAVSRKRALAVGSTPASFNPVIAVFGAAMVGFASMIYLFPRWPCAALLVLQLGSLTNYTRVGGTKLSRYARCWLVFRDKTLESVLGAFRVKLYLRPDSCRRSYL